MIKLKDMERLLAQYRILPPENKKKVMEQMESINNYKGILNTDMKCNCWFCRWFT